MGLHLVTGRSGNAHVSAADIASFNAGTLGGGTYVFPGDSTFDLSIESNNRIMIYGGQMMIQGRYVSMPYADASELKISNGMTGLNRIDLIVIRYTHDFDTGIEKAEFAVIEGESVKGTATKPSYTAGNLLTGGCALHEEPLYEIPINGIALGAPVKCFTVAKPTVSTSGDTMTGTLNFKRIFDGVEHTGGIFPSAYLIGDDKTFGMTRMVDGKTDSVLYFNKNGLGLYDGESDFSFFSRVVKGTYTGDGTSERTINLGFTPKAVLVSSGNGRFSGFNENSKENLIYGGLAVEGFTATNYAVAVTNGGFKVSHSNTVSGGVKKLTNTNGDIYCYIAIR
jgi:hypothetical protein